MLKNILLFLFSLNLLSFPLWAQSTLSDSIASKTLGETRNLRIQLPKSFSPATTTTYPLILTLDGEYMFYAVASNANLLLVNEKMPEVIVVGIDQNYPGKNKRYARWLDCDYSSKTGLLNANGQAFKDFIVSELLPYLAVKYHTNGKATICGHSFTANYLNYFLIDPASPFNTYLAVSPYVPAVLQDPLLKSCEMLDQHVFYALCMGSKDLSGHVKNIRLLHKSRLSRVQNPHFQYLFADYEGETHYSLIARSLYPSLKAAFQTYAAIDDEAADAMAKSKDIVASLKQKYADIKEFYGLDIPIREDDLNTAAYVAESTKKMEVLKAISQLTIDRYPDSPYGYYNLGLYHEKLKAYALALTQYKIGYSKLGDDVSNKADFYQDITRMVEKLKVLR